MKHDINIVSKVTTMSDPSGDVHLGSKIRNKHFIASEINNRTDST